MLGLPRAVMTTRPPLDEVPRLRWIATELGLAEGTVHAHLHTARGKLIAGLERYYPFGQDSGEGAVS